MRRGIAAFGVIVFLLMAPRSYGALVEANLVAPLSAAEFQLQPSDSQQLQLSIAGSSYVVSSGDTVRVIWTFADGETFELLPGAHLGLRAWLTPADGVLPPKVFQASSISWSLLDGDGVPVLSGSEGKTKIHWAAGEINAGGLTMANPSVLDVGGLVMELTDVENLGIGGLPLEFRGARFLLDKATFGPRLQAPPAPTPEPATLALIAIAFAGLGVRRAPRRRRR